MSHVLAQLLFSAIPFLRMSHVLALLARKGLANSPPNLCGIYSTLGISGDFVLLFAACQGGFFQFKGSFLLFEGDFFS